MSANSFKLPGDGWFHVVPIGRFPIRDPEKKGREIIQVIDNRAVSQMHATFDREAKAPRFPGLLVDFDHFSYDTDKSSRAAGWLIALENREDGLWGKIRLTENGEKLLQSGDFRFISPVFDKRQAEKISDTEFRPVRLDTLAVTNAPNIKGMVPLTNRAELAWERVISAGGFDSSFGVLLNRAADEMGDAARGLQLVRVEEREAYEATDPVERITLLVNRVRLETGVKTAEAWDLANRIAPEEFDAADPRYATGRSEEQIKAARMDYRARVLANRHKCSLAEAWNLIDK